MSNPIEAIIEYLVECGWEREQAVNLCRAIKADSPEKLWELAPKWIEHCGESMRYVRDMLGVVAHGLVDVTRADDGEWMFQLNDNGMQAGAAIAHAPCGLDCRGSAKVARAEEGAMNWQPIETAPKDGTTVDLWVGDYRIPGCKWERDDFDGEYGWAEYISRCSECMGGSGWVKVCGTPTHWMPRPAPPKP